MVVILTFDRVQKCLIAEEVKEISDHFGKYLLMLLINVFNIYTCLYVCHHNV